MSDVIVFLGPTLEHEVARTMLQADYLPPAAQGDVYRAALRRPRAIVLIDGYHRNVPAVWHKEILWALAQGIAVFGAASMGALRAYELHPFGMKGIGWVFNQFAEGILEDDDEVAIAHAAGELEYRALSEAMVNIRATGISACEAGVMTDREMQTLCAAAKKMAYQDRSWPALWRTLADGSVAGARLADLRAWVALHRIDQKRLDAASALNAVKRWLSEEPRKPNACALDFAHTDAWEAFVQRHRPAASLGAEGEPVLYTMLLRELQLRGIWARAYYAAWARSQSDRGGDRRSAVDRTAVQQTADQFRRERGLLQPEQFDAWIEAQAVADAELGPLFVRETRARRSEQQHAQQLAVHVVDYLRATGEFARLSRAAIARSRRQQETLLRVHELSALGLDESGLWSWYFEHFRNCKPPADLSAYARLECLCSVEDLRHLVIQEYQASARVPARSSCDAGEEFRSSSV